MMDHAEIAMDGARAVEHVSARAGRVQRACDLLPDVRRFARAGDADSPRAVENQIDDLEERAIEAVGDLLEGGGLSANDLARVRQPVGVVPQLVRSVQVKAHGRILASWGASPTRPRGATRWKRAPQRHFRLPADYTGQARKCNGRAAGVLM